MVELQRFWFCMHLLVRENYTNICPHYPQSDIELHPLLFPEMPEPLKRWCHNWLLMALDTSRHFDILPKQWEAAWFRVTSHTNAQWAWSLPRIILPIPGVGHGPLTVRAWYQLKTREFKHSWRTWVSVCWCKERELPRNNDGGRKIPGILTADRSHVCAKTRKEIVKNKHSSEAVTPVRLPAERECVIFRTL